MKSAIKHGDQYINHKGKDYRLKHAGYRWIMHKWSFLIERDDSFICGGQKITFLNTRMTVCFTERRNTTDTCGSKEERETFVEAWIL